MRFVYHKIKTFTVGQTLVCVCDVAGEGLFFWGHLIRKAEGIEHLQAHDWLRATHGRSHTIH